MKYINQFLSIQPFQLYKIDDYREQICNLLLIFTFSDIQAIKFYTNNQYKMSRPYGKVRALKYVIIASLCALRIIKVHQRIIIYLISQRVIQAEVNYDYNNLTMQEQKAKNVDNSYLEALSCEQVFNIRMHYQSDEDSWMRHFEQRQRLEQVFEEQDKVSLVLEGTNAKYHQESVQPPQNLLPTQRSRNSSMFHNHQKNLVSLLRRLINVDRKDLVKLPHGLEAFNLWKWFVNGGLKCKKALFIVFGTNVLKNEQFLREVALQSPNLQKWLNNINKDEVEESQKLLREIVHQKAAGAEKKTIQKISQVKDFPPFYRYFLIFVEELSEGALPLRMPKTLKAKHMTHEQ